MSKSTIKKNFPTNKLSILITKLSRSVTFLLLLIFMFCLIVLVLLQTNFFDLSRFTNSRLSEVQIIPLSANKSTATDSDLISPLQLSVKKIENNSDIDKLLKDLDAANIDSVDLLLSQIDVSR